MAIIHPKTKSFHRTLKCPDCKSELKKTKGRVIEFLGNGLGREEEIIFWKCKCRINNMKGR